MNIIEVGPLKANTVKFDNGQTYYRFGPYDWYERMGESLEPIYADTDLLEDLLEEAFEVWSKIPL
jgi:hypothetical protein